MFTPKFVTLKNGLNLWVESAGDANNPPLLLHAGAGLQCISWSEEFCQEFLKLGYFVIRYDYRDTGLSSNTDVKTNPYTVMDLSEDAVAILDSYNLLAAHHLGFSMGGQIAQFIGAYFPENVLTLTLLSTSISFEEGFNAFAGKPHAGLSAPNKEYVKWITQNNSGLQTAEEKLQTYLTTWQLLNGKEAKFDETSYIDMLTKSFQRSQIDPYPNHALAMQASYEDHKKAPALIKSPTLIIHGGCDPVFGTDHGYALQQAIKDSKLVIINNLGHAINSVFYHEIATIITNHINQYLSD